MVIDWAAVEFAVTGSSMRNLTQQERRMVVRRVAHRLPANGDGPMPWQVSARQLGERLGVSGRTIERIKTDLPEATQTVCPVCGTQMWVHTDGTVEPHPDSLLLECPFSGHNLYQADGVDVAAATVAWLSQWRDAGDEHGVTSYLQGLPEPHRTALMSVAGVAAVVTGDEERFGWMFEAAS